MKKIPVLLLCCVTSFFASFKPVLAIATPLEVFCTQSQCEKIGVSSSLLNVDVYIIDSHLITANKLSETYLKGDTTLEQAEAKLPAIQNSILYNEMISQLKRSGEGLQKIVSEYQLKRLPAFVCKRQNVTTGHINIAVVYGGSYTTASSTCSHWVNGGKA
jgi:hypothetical protein